MASPELLAALQRRADLESGARWASPVRPWLYLGSGRDAANVEKLEQHGVTHILNVADDVENFHEGARTSAGAKRFQYLNLGIADFGQDPGIGRCFARAQDFVGAVRAEAAQQEGGDAEQAEREEQEEPREDATGAAETSGPQAPDGSGGSRESAPSAVVLVHCANGSNRSVTVVVAVLMLLEGLNLAEAMQHVRACRPSARPLKDNWRELEHLERELGRGSTSTG